MTWRKWFAVGLLWCGVSHASASIVAAQGATTSTSTQAAATVTSRVTSSVTSPHGTQLREACASCHKADAWKPARIAPTFRHAEKTFPLSGAHERVACMSCHKQLDFQGATNSCASCHADPHKSEFGVSCARCHNTRSFVDRGTAVRTHQATRFPLRGAHAVAVCESCHTPKGPGQLQYAAQSTTCQSCHMATFRATRSPNHTAAHFASDCTSCHTISSWGGALFDHNTTTFPLTGTHQRTTCAGCHADNVYTGRSTTCVSCHQADYAAAQEPRHSQGFPTACESCHGTTQWKGARFDHQAQTKYPLTGKHVTAACTSCHVSGRYAGTPTTCITCHQPDYARTAAPPHQAAGFATTCEGCHTTATWTGAPFDHATTRFALTGGHRTVTCAGCHSDNIYRNKSMLCASCHQAKANATTNPHHIEAKFASTCESCHTTAAWSGAQFNHAQTRFALTGRHVPATCLACHADKVYAGKPSACASCHQSSYDGTSQPNHRVLGFPLACEGCHTTTQWLGAQFDHSVNTQFPLTGAHQTVACSGCHQDGVYRGKPTTCVGCHQTKYDATTSPHHAQARFATTCQSCHTTQQWTGSLYDHNQTRFPLLGSHVSATCLACHSDRVYAGKPSVCQSCHQTQYDATTTPNHRTAGIPVTCETCHTATSWRPSIFNHDLTQFALNGAHRAVNCQSCHGDGVYRGKATTCVSCHQAKFDATTQPNHRTTGYATTCENCHSVLAWKPASFDHGATQFPLIGAHRAVTCESCHADGVFRGKPTTCVSCHQARFDATTQPNHRTSGFPTTCQTCHTSVSWKPGTFDHALTQFPLVGAHRAVSCQTCHGDGVYGGKPTTCVSCHQPKFNATTRPNHQSLGYATTCQTCHTSVAWTPSTWSHNTTQFALTGAHLPATCLACHSDGVYRGKPKVCVACHQTQYNAAINPNHVTAGFPTTCQTCHSTSAWRPGTTFNHSTTQFPLVGAHQAVSCQSCHGDGVYAGKPTTCVSCHQPKFNATTRPNHQSLGYATTCQTCHTSVAWTPSTWSHNTTQFALTGAHVSATCLACHSDGVYRGKPTTCVSCHQTKFNATTNPNHVTAGFPTSCQTCHTTATWTPATFDHAATQFPLIGAHRAVTCQSCHGDGVYAGKPTTCVSCHQAKFNATTRPNHQSLGYATTCQTCHTSVAWTPSTWSHNTTPFALTGAHVSATCLACHNDGVYRGKPKVCSACHLTQYNATTNPNHRTAFFPTTCESCHTTTQWTGATFNHDGPWFPIYSGKHKSKWSSCVQCHTNNANYKEFTCLTCHEHRQSEMDSKHQGRSGYSYTSIACYSCHPRGTH